MARVAVSPQAEADLTRIGEEIADKAGVLTADRVVDRIVHVIERLSAIPRSSGRLVPALGHDLRCHPVGSYNVYLRYDEKADVLSVVRVLHGRRNITAMFFK